MIGRPETPLFVRFWRKVQKTPSGCWEWGGARHLQGYGFIKRKDGAQLRAHRVSYEIHYGPIPDGFDVCHRCDNPPCVNPEHLFLGTDLDNMQDMIAKGRKVSSPGVRNGQAKLTEEDVLSIRAARGRQEAIAALYDVSQTLVSSIKSGRRWAHL
jgi:hypothetical protein